MAKRKAGTKKAKQATDGQNGGVVALTKELFQAAITLRGSVEPADYKRYVLPIIFLRFLSLRYDRRRAELEALVADKKSDYYRDKKAIHDPDEYRRVGAFVIPELQRSPKLTQGCSPKVDHIDFPPMTRASRDAHEAALLHLPSVVCAGPPRRPSPARVFGVGLSDRSPRADTSLLASA